MKKFIVIAWVLLLTIVGCGNEKPAHPYLPTGDITVDVLGALPLPPNLAGLAQTDMEAFLAEVEGREFTQVMRQAEINVRLRDSLLIIDGGEEIPELTSVTLELESQVLVTPFGVLESKREIEPVPDQFVTGPWRGEQWRLLQVSSAVGELSGNETQDVLIVFALGQLEGTNRGILNYLVQIGTGDEIDTDYNLLLTYDLDQ